MHAPDKPLDHASSDAVVDVCNPVTGERIGSYKQIDSDELRQRIAAARLAQPSWSRLTLAQRQAFIAKMRAWLTEHAEEAADLVRQCVGKRPIEALAGDVMPSIFGSAWYERQAPRMLRPRKLKPGSLLFLNKRSVLHRKPHGVVGIIAPWNYPLGIPMHEIVPALLAGNTVLLKTAPETLPVGELIARMFKESGLPENVFQHVIVDGPACGDVMLAADGVNKLCFTGSVRVGKILAEKAARQLVPISLELGGKDAMIVLPDADIQRAAEGAVFAGMMNAGQSCAGVERLYVHESIHDDFMRALKNTVDGLRWSEETPFDSDIGPLCTERQANVVRQQVEAALAAGATIHAEAPFTTDSTRLIKPLVLSNVSHDMEVMREETFGPIIGVMTFKDEADVIELANDSRYALTASVWSRNRKHARELAGHLKAGAVTINDHMLSHGLTETPWGGPGDSGLGRGHGEFAFEAMTDPQVVIDDWLGFAQRNVFWYPFSRSIYDGLLGGIHAIHGRGLARRLKGVGKLLKILPRMFKRSK
ncbi:MAG: aldehyde dehydrogenase family protein [Gammaproteobacteria bacterium]|nr:aldehyde dehydrogenase family protein [Gammaproteobacteria bacterium]